MESSVVNSTAALDSSLSRRRRLVNTAAPEASPTSRINITLCKFNIVATRHARVAMSFRNGNYFARHSACSRALCDAPTSYTVHRTHRTHRTCGIVEGARNKIWFEACGIVWICNFAFGVRKLNAIESCAIINWFSVTRRKWNDTNPTSCAVALWIKSICDNIRYSFVSCAPFFFFRSLWFCFWKQQITQW